MSYTDRELLKQQERGQLGTTGATTPYAEISRVHEELITFEVPADATVVETGVYIAKACKVKSIEFLPNAALAAHASNYVTQLVQKRDGAGGAAVTVGTLDTNTAGGNQSLAAFQKTSFVLTNANINVAAGNVLTFKSTETGTPVTPIGKVSLTVEYV